MRDFNSMMKLWVKMVNESTYSVPESFKKKYGDNDEEYQEEEFDDEIVTEKDDDPLSLDALFGYGDVDDNIKKELDKFDDADKEDNSEEAVRARGDARADSSDDEITDDDKEKEKVIKKTADDEEAEEDEEEEISSGMEGYQEPSDYDPENSRRGVTGVDSGRYWGSDVGEGIDLDEFKDKVSNLLQKFKAQILYKEYKGDRSVQEINSDIRKFADSVFDSDQESIVDEIAKNIVELRKNYNSKENKLIRNSITGLNREIMSLFSKVK